MASYNNQGTALWQLQDKEREERINLPWRRMLARAVDLVFYLLLWWPVALYGLRLNPLLLHWIPCSSIMFAVSFIIMIALEPVFIAIFGTTPGKAIFGIAVRKKSGKKLTVLQGYIRIFRLMARGCGFVIIPIYNFVRMYQSYKLCQVEGSVSWDKQFDFFYKGKFKVRLLLAIAAAAIIAIFLTAMYYGADMPQTRGQLTVAQLEANVEDYWSYHDTAWNTELYYTVNLQFYDISAGHIFDRMDPPEVVFEETDGVVTGVVIEFTDASRTVLMALPTWLRGYTISYVGAQKGMNFIKMHAPGGVLDTLLAPVNEIIEKRMGTEGVRFFADGVEIILEIEADEKISVSFTMRQS